MSTDYYSNNYTRAYNVNGSNEKKLMKAERDKEMRKRERADLYSYTSSIRRLARGLRPTAFN